MSDETTVADSGTEATSGITGDAAPAAEPAAAPVEAAPASSSPQSFYGEEGAVNPDAVSGLPKSLQSIIGKYKNNDDLGKGIDHLNFMASSKGFEPLSPDANEADRAKHNEIMRSVNRTPETAEGYNVQRPESYSEEEWDGSSMSKYVDVLHKHNASPELVNELMESAGSSMAEIKEQMAGQAETARQEQITAAQEKWGNNTQKMFNDANQVADTFGLPRDQIRSIEMVEALNKIKAGFSEDKLTQSDTVLDNSENYEAQADAIYNGQNPNFDLTSRDHGMVKRANQELTRLLTLSESQKKKGTRS